MLASAFLALCCVLFSTREVHAQNGIAIKKTQFPYVGYIFYPDGTLVDASGARFVRGALLVKPDWLVSAAVDPLIPAARGFPDKTLLARLGATNIDQKFTLNEDEDEQEREVVKLVRPSIHEFAAPWRTDICLLKTLFPFKPTLAVGVLSLHLKHTNTEKSCTILAFMESKDKLHHRDRIALLNDVEATCVPEYEGESVGHIVETVALKLGVSLDGRYVVSAMRVGRRPTETEGAQAQPVDVGNSGLKPGLEDKTLTQLSVEILPKCGEGVDDNTTICAIDGEDTKAAMSNPEFCIGNSGGPLICEGEVMGLQTYIKNNCSAPHLYQRLSRWQTFITCGTEEKCNESQCSDTCQVVNKDIEIKRTQELSLGVLAISNSPVYLPATPIVSRESNDMDSEISGSTGPPTPTITESLKLASQPEQARKSEQTENQILQYNDLVPLAAAGKTQLAPTMTELTTEEVTGAVKSDKKLSVSTVTEEPLLSRAESGLVVKETIQPKEVSNLRSSEIKKRGKVQEPVSDARKANMEAQIEDTQGAREPRPVRTRNLYRANPKASGAVKLHFLCYEIAIVFTLLVIAM